MTVAYSQDGFAISLSPKIVHFKLSSQYLSQQSPRPEELVSRQLLKALHRERCLRILEFKPTKYFPRHVGFRLDALKNGHFP